MDALDEPTGLFEDVLVFHNDMVHCGWVKYVQHATLRDGVSRVTCSCGSEQ